MSNTLPTPRSLATTLINTISSSLPRIKDANPLLNPPASTKNLLLTLHVLFPTELLPALDLLDRRLVTRLTPSSLSAVHEHAATIQSESSDAEHAEPHTTSVGEQTLKNKSGAPPVYIIRSAQQPSTTSHSRFRDATAAQYYEVRTRAWNCTCPAFTFSAFSATLESDEEGEDDEPYDNDDEDDAVKQREDSEAIATSSAEQMTEKEWHFGGASLGRKSLPVCKHLLACVLVERVEALSDAVVLQSVSREELAGWVVR